MTASPSGGSDLAQGFGIECEALDHVLTVVGLPQRGGVAALRVFAEERSRMGRPSVYELARFCSDLLVRC